MNAAYDSGEIPLPSGYAYMMSGGQRLGPDEARFRPHFMLYTPYAYNAEIGGEPFREHYPFIGPVEGHPLATLTITLDAFVEPEAVVVPEHLRAALARWVDRLGER